MSEQQWYYELLTEEFGPIPMSEIQQLITDGTLAPEDRVRPNSSNQWITVARFPATVRAMSDDESDEDDNRHSSLDIDSFSFEVSSATGADDLDIDSFNLHGDSDSPQPVVTNHHKPTEPESVDEVEEEDEPTFFVQSLGQVFGPLTQDELVEMACAGSLSRGDEISGSEDGRWIAVEAIPGLSTEIMRQDAGTANQPKTPAVSPRKKKKKKTANKAPAADKAKSTAPKRKRKRKTDEFLQEIFAEVFTADGKVREDRASAASAAAAVIPAATTTTPMHHNETLPAAPVMNSSTTTTPASPPPAFTKPPTPARPPAKKAAKSSDGFKMPEPKVLGMIGGGVAVLLILVGGFMGIIPLPGFGVNPDSFFKEFAGEYQKAHAGSVKEWQDFKGEYVGTARQIARSLASSAGSDPNAKRQQNAALIVDRIMRTDQADKEKHQSLYAEFNKVLVGG